MTAISTTVSLRSGAEGPFARWQASLTRAAAAAEGFVGIELLPAFQGSADWQVVQRFRTHRALAQWQASPERTRLLAELAPMRDPEGVDRPDEAAPDFHSLACVTEVVTTAVEPGGEAAYQAWAEAVQAAQALFPGYLGTLVQAPISADAPHWTTLVRFSTPQQLESWLGSAERKALLERSDPGVSRWTSRRMTSPFAGWFEARPDQPPPAAWKQTALVLLVLFPIVMLEIRFLSPYLAGLHPALATFIGNAISVSLVSWPLMGLAVACLGWWLHPAPARRRQVEILGAGTVLALYAVELLIFMVWR